MPQQLSVEKPTQEIFFDPKTICERLFHLSMRSGYAIIQRNGQRYYGPPPDWVGGPPEKGSEIFIGRLPRDVFEDELIPVFESIAPLYEARLMLNFTGSNRGFAFITYCNSRDAFRAAVELNNYEIRPGHKIGVAKSINNCRLYLGGIPLNRSKAEVWEEIMKICPTVKDVIMYSNPGDRTKNRGFLFIEFESHRSAAMAKRALVPCKLWKKDVVVDWADPEPDINPEIMSTITKLFIRNLTLSSTPDIIRMILQDTIPPSAIQRIYLAGHYGFIHFDCRVHAQMAMERLSLVVVDGELLEVKWARPKYFKKSAYSNFRFLPPRLRGENVSTVESHEEYLLPDNVHRSFQANNNYKHVQQYPVVPFPVYNQPAVMYNHNPMSVYSH